MTNINIEILYFGEKGLNIYNLVKEGKTYKEIAKLYNVSPSRIGQIYLRTEREIELINKGIIKN